MTDRMTDLWCVLEWQMDDPWEAPELLGVHGPLVSERLANEFAESLRTIGTDRFTSVEKMKRLLP